MENSIRNLDRYNQYNPKDVMGVIGLNTSTFNGKIVDVGCGIDGLTVLHLREMFHLPAEGIDELVNNPTYYLIKGDAASIPRQDNYYDKAFSHVSAYRDGSIIGAKFLANLVGNREEFTERFGLLYHKMVDVTYEVLRVLKRGGDFSIWPFPAVFLNLIKDDPACNQLNFKIEEVKLKFEIPDNSFLEPILPDYRSITEYEFGRRLVFIKP